MTRFAVFEYHPPKVEYEAIFLDENRLDDIAKQLGAITYRLLHFVANPDVDYVRVEFHRPNGIWIQGHVGKWIVRPRHPEGDVLNVPEWMVADDNMLKNMVRIEHDTAAPYDR